MNYTVNIAAAALPGDPPNLPIMREDGPTMLFELIALVSVETRATVATLGRKLDDMAAIMRTVKSNVQEFNAEVETIVDALNARNAPVPELRTKLFTGYKSCGDSAFIKYIVRKEEEYEDGLTNLTATQLMQVALEKFKTLTDKGEWMVKTEQELEFIALKAWQLEQINKKSNVTKSAKVERDGTKKKTKAKFAWKMISPKAGEPESKTVNGKKYIFCPHHHTTRWVLEVNQQGVNHKTGCRVRDGGPKKSLLSATSWSKTRPAMDSVATTAVIAKKTFDGDGVDGFAIFIGRQALTR